MQRLKTRTSMWRRFNDHELAFPVKLVLSLFALMWLTEVLCNLFGVGTA